MLTPLNQKSKFNPIKNKYVINRTETVTTATPTSATATRRQVTSLRNYLTSMVTSPNNRDSGVEVGNSRNQDHGGDSDNDIVADHFHGNQLRHHGNQVQVATQPRVQNERRTRNLFRSKLERLSLENLFRGIFRDTS